MNAYGQLALADGMMRDVLEAVRNYHGAVPVALAIGVLEIAKLQIVQDAANCEDDEE